MRRRVGDLVSANELVFHIHDDVFFLTEVGLPFLLRPARVGVFWPVFIGYFVE